MLWRMQEGLGEFLVEQKFCIALGQGGQFGSENCAITGEQQLRALFADLRSVTRDPDAFGFRARIPEGNVFLEVAGTCEHLVGDGPVNVDLAPGDVFKDAVVRGGFAANVVVFGQAVDRDGDAYAGKFHPFDGDGDYTTGYDKREDFHFGEDGQDATEFAMADERFASHDRDVLWFVPADQFENAVNECLAAKIAEFAEGNSAPEVRVAVGVTARAAQRTFTRNFDGEHGDAATENAAPRGQKLARLDAVTWPGLFHEG